MSEEMVRKIADGADMIVRGYAFTRADDFIRVFNLNDRESSMVITSDGSTVVQKQGALTDQELRKIQSFIKEHYLEIYEMWKTDSDNGFYEK